MDIDKKQSSTNLIKEHNSTKCKLTSKASMLFPYGTQSEKSVTEDTIKQESLKENKKSSSLKKIFGF